MKRFLAIFLGSQSSTRFEAWNALPHAQREAQHKAAVAAWHAWVEKHKAAIVDGGGPLGKTKTINTQGVTDTRNLLTGYTLIEAESHEAAARLFENHPHFSMMPGESVEIMEVLPIPGK